jgi:hypothetical protein
LILDRESGPSVVYERRGSMNGAQCAFLQYAFT